MGEISMKLNRKDSLVKLRQRARLKDEAWGKRGAEVTGVKIGQGKCFLPGKEYALKSPQSQDRKTH
jgi:hypothetical protein